MSRNAHPLITRGGSSAVMALAFALCGLWATPASAVTLDATDAGFVTEMGGSSKGDGTLVAAAKYNYSVGFEEHYVTGALGPVFAPMLRKNYFVFDLTSITMPIASAKLMLYTGALETADPFELYALHAITDMPIALSLAADLAAGTTTAEFDEIDDPLVIKAKDLFMKLGSFTDPLLADPIIITSAMDDTVIELPFSPAGLGYLSSFAGGMVMLSGLVPSVDGALFPQQPFGFTGPDIPDGLTGTPIPTLVLTLVPEPAAAWLMLIGLAALPVLRRNRVRPPPVAA